MPTDYLFYATSMTEQFYAEHREAIFNAVKSADKRVSGARVVWAGEACFHKNKQTRYT